VENSRGTNLRTVPKHVRDMGCCDKPPINAKSSVIVSVGDRGPQPALIRTTPVNLGPEPRDILLNQDNVHRRPRKQFKGQRIATP